jgi:RNA polymerase primary sigma factor
MNTRTKSLRSHRAADDSVVSRVPTPTLAPAPHDAPPSFLEKAEPAAAPAAIPHGERSNLQLYLQEIGKTPLLTIAEEIQLAEKIRRGTKPPATT